MLGLVEDYGYYARYELAKSSTMTVNLQFTGNFCRREPGVGDVRAVLSLAAGGGPRAHHRLHPAPADAHTEPRARRGRLLRHAHAQTRGVSHAVVTYMEFLHVVRMRLCR